jgi:hypothetical protein
MLRTTVSRAVCLGIKHPSGCCQTFAGLLLWGALSDERTGLSFTIAAGPHQRSRSRFRVPSDSRPSFTVTDSRLPFSSPPTTRRVTVQVFDPASTQDSLLSCLSHPLKTVIRELNREHLIEGLSLSIVMQRLLVPTRITVCLVVAMETLLSVA